MYRIAIIAFGVLLCLTLFRVVTAENGAPVDKPAAAKGDREKVQPKRPAGLDDREDVKQPAAKACWACSDRSKRPAPRPYWPVSGKFPTRRHNR